ncbi:MAG: RNA 2'-phosphotransferase [Candidatus Omnitrophota bacterium]|nr:RNA 2'-phosphotransferase [Candidatus Omnitrophota bacterium]
MSPIIPYEFDAERFSRWMSYVLRHNPDRYGLAPDRHGYVDLEEFLRIAQRRYPAVTPERLRSLVEGAGVERFEIAANRLRARYGHSISADPPGPPVEPPAQLYYGTDAAQVVTLLMEGLRPLERRMVHVSQTAEDAWRLAQRKTSQPALIAVDAADAHRQGVAFFREGSVYLAASIPPQYLRRFTERPDMVYSK